jgi:hypothetical protein
LAPRARAGERSDTATRSRPIAQQLARQQKGQAEKARCESRQRGEQQRARRYGFARRPGARNDLHLDGNGAGIRRGAGGLELGLQALKFRTLRLGQAFQRPQFYIVGAGTDDARFGLFDALAHALLTQGGNFGLTFEALDHIADLRLDLLLEPGEIGLELLHARVGGQQRR